MSKTNANQNRTFELSLPLFGGFYYSIYDEALNECTSSEEIDAYRESENDSAITENDFDYDYDRYREAVAKAYMETFFDALEEYCPELVESYAYKDVWSPREYNFQTDKVIVSVTFREGWQDAMLAFMDGNKEWLTKMIKDEYTSFDGYISHLSSHEAVWETFIECPESADSYFECYIEALLRYMMELHYGEDEAFHRLNDDTLEDLYMGEFVTLREKKTYYVIFKYKDANFEAPSVYTDKDAAYKEFNEGMEEYRVLTEAEGSELEVWDEIGGREFASYPLDTLWRVICFETRDELVNIWMYANTEDDEHFQIRDCNIGSFYETKDNYKSIRDDIDGSYTDREDVHVLGDCTGDGELTQYVIEHDEGRCGHYTGGIMMCPMGNFLKDDEKK